jgi:hypothetical protein
MADCIRLYLLILGDDWRAMFRNSRARNLAERRAELFNAILERVG